MSKQFDSFSKFSKFLDTNAEKLPMLEKAFGLAAAKYVESKAKDKIGNKQQEWEDLKWSTKADKARKGYVFKPDYNPLYREGDLRESIKGYYNQNLRILFLGSASMIAFWQAVGTKSIPPRDFIGNTMQESTELLAGMWAQVCLQALAGKWLRVVRYGGKSGFSLTTN